MAVGRRPVPAEIKKKRGTLRARPTLVSTRALTDRLADRPAPDGLGDTAVAHYRRIIDVAGDWLAPSDADAVATLARLLQRQSDLIARLDSDGVVLYTDKGYAYAHPAAGMLTTTEREIARWSSLLGLTPTDRTRLGLAMVRGVSKLDEFQRRVNEA